MQPLSSAGQTPVTEPAAVVVVVCANGSANALAASTARPGPSWRFYYQDNASNSSAGPLLPAALAGLLRAQRDELQAEIESVRRSHDQSSLTSSILRKRSFRLASMVASRNSEINRIVAAHAQAVYDSYSQERRAINAERDADALRDRFLTLQRQNESIRQMYRNQTQELSRSRRRTLRLATNVISKGTHINSLTNARDRALREAYLQSHLLRQCEKELDQALAQIEDQAHEFDSILPRSSSQEPTDRSDVAAESDGSAAPAETSISGVPQSESRTRTRIEQLKSQFGAYRDGIHQLRTANEELSQKLLLLKDDNAALQALASNTSISLDSLSAQKRTAQEALKTLQAQVENLEASLLEQARSYEVNNAELNHARTDLENQLAQSRTQLEWAAVNHDSIVQHLQLQLQQGMDERLSLSEQVARFEAKLAEISQSQEQQLGQSQAIINEATTARQSLEYELAETRRELEAARSNTIQLEAEHKSQMDTLQHEIEKVSHSKEILQSDLDAEIQRGKEESAKFSHREEALTVRCSDLEVEVENAKQMALEASESLAQKRLELGDAIATLKGNVSKLEQEREAHAAQEADLSIHNAKLHRHVLELKTKLDISNSRISEVETELDTAQARVSAIEKELNSSESRVVELRSKLGSSDSAVTDLKADIANLQTKLGTAIWEKQKLKDLFDDEQRMRAEDTKSLEKQVSLFVEQNKSLAQSVTDLRKEVATTRADLTEKNKVYQLALEETSKLQASLQESHEKVEQSQTKAADDLRTAQAEHSRLKDKLAKFTKIHNDYKQQQVVCQDTLQKNLDDKTHALGLERAEKVELQAQYDSLSQEFDVYKTDRDELKKDLDQSTALHEDIKKLILELEAKVRLQEDAVAEKTLSLMTANQQLRSQSELHQKTKAQIDLLNAELQRRDAGSKSVEAKLQRTIESASSAASEYNAQIDQLKKEKAVLEETTTTLRVEISEIRTSHEAKAVQLKKEKAELEDEKIELEGEADRLKLEKSKLESRTNQLEEDKSELEEKAERLWIEKSELEGRAGRLQTEKSELEAERTTVQTKLLDARAIHEGETDRLNSQLSDLDVSLRATKDALDAKQREIELRIEEHNRAMERSADDTATLKRQHSTELAELTARINELAGKELDLLDQRAELTSSLSNTETLRNQEKQESKARMMELAGLEARVTDLSAQKFGLLEQRAKLEAGLAESGDARKKLADLNASQETELAELRATAGNLEKARADLMSQKVKVEVSLAKSEAARVKDTDEASCRIGELSKSRAKVQADLDSVWSELSTVKRLLDQARDSSVVAQQKHDRDIADWTRMITELESELTAVRRARDQDVSSLRKQINDTIAQNQTETCASTAKIGQLEATAAVLQGQIQIKSSEVDMLRRELNVKIDLSTRQLEAASSEKAKADTAVANLQSRLDDAIASREKLEAVAQSCQRDLEAELSGAQVRIDSLSNLSRSLQGTISDYEARNQSLAKTVRDLEGRLEMQVGEAERAKVARSTMESQVEEQEVLIKKSDETAGNLESLITVLQDHVTVLECHLDSLKAEVKSERLLRTHVQDKLTDSASRLIEVEGQLAQDAARAADQVRLITARNNELTRLVEQADKKASNSAEELRIAERQLELASETISRLERLLETSEKSLDSVGDFTAKCGLQLDQFILKSENQMAEINRESTQHRRRLDRALGEVSQLRTTNRDLSDEKVRLEKRVGDLETLVASHPATIRIQDQSIATPPPSSPSTSSLVADRDFQTLPLAPAADSTSTRPFRLAGLAMSRWRHSYHAPKSVAENEEPSPPVTSAGLPSPIMITRSPVLSNSSSRRPNLLSWRRSRRVTSPRTPPRPAAHDFPNGLGSPMASRLSKAPRSSHSVSSHIFSRKKTAEDGDVGPVVQGPGLPQFEVSPAPLGPATGPAGASAASTSVASVIKLGSDVPVEKKSVGVFSKILP